MRKNAFMEKKRIHDAELVKRSSMFAYRTFLDVLAITLDDYGVSKERIVEMLKSFRLNLNEYANIVVDDNEVDREMDYSKEVLDRRLRLIFGDDLIPYEQRYELKKEVSNGK